MDCAPICYDLYCGLGGWAEGFLAEGYTVIGFDVERHDYGTGGYPGQLVLQDVRTIHGSQLRNATVIVASPPCTEPSYRAMPWKRAKALNAVGPPHKFIELFETCFRIQREACEAAGRHIPLIVENVKGAQPWVGKAAWHFGSYYLWGDIPALMPITFARKSQHIPHGEPLGKNTLGRKCGGSWFGKGNNCSLMRQHSSKSDSRKAASAQIAKIPFPLAVHIAKCFKVQEAELVASAPPSAAEVSE